MRMAVPLIEVQANTASMILSWQYILLTCCSYGCETCPVYWKKPHRLGVLWEQNACARKKHVRGKVGPVLTIKAHRVSGCSLYLYSFSTSALDEGRWPTSCSGRLTARKYRGTHWIGAWMGCRSDVDVLDDSRKKSNREAGVHKCRPGGSRGE